MKRFAPRRGLIVKALALGALPFAAAPAAAQPGGPCGTPISSSPYLYPQTDQRCGALSDLTAHHSIDAKGLVNSPGGFVTAGERMLPTGQQGLHVVSWTATGRIDNQRLFHTFVNGEALIATSVDVNNNCDVLVAGRIQTPGGATSAFVARLDYQLNFVWATRLPGTQAGGQNVQADWLNGNADVAACGMVGTGSTPRVGFVTKLDANTGACIWRREYSSQFSATDRFLIEDLEQAPDGKIWVCGGIESTQNGSPTTRLPMVMELTVAGANSGPYVYPFPPGSIWTNSRFNAIKFNPTPGPYLGDIVVAGWVSRVDGPPPFGLPVVVGRVALLDRIPSVPQIWDNVYSGFSFTPGTSAISIMPLGTPNPNNLIVVAGRDQDSYFGRTLRVLQANGALDLAQTHGNSNIPFQTHKFDDITPGGRRVMVGVYSDLGPIPAGGAQLYLGEGSCPTTNSATAQSMMYQVQQPGEIGVNVLCAGQSMDLLPAPVQTLCTTLCRSSRFGDLNCDENFDFFDIDAFLIAIFDPSGYATLYPDCNIWNADLNGDAAVDFFDIDPFLACLFGVCP